MRKIVWLIVLVVATCSPGKSEGAIVTYEFSGNVGFVGGMPGGISASFLDPLTGTFTLDTSLLDTFVGPAIGSYAHNITNGVTLTINGTTVTFNTYSVDVFSTSLPDPFLRIMGSGGGLNFRLIIDDVFGVLTTDALPDPLPLPQGMAGSLEQGSEDRITFNATVTRIQGPVVPEPSSLTLLAIGVVALVGHTRRQRRKNRA